jgi:hypothetical protein
METIITLATFVFLAGGQMQPRQAVDVPGTTTARALQSCWSLANEFVKLDPKALGGVALGAGCVVRSGRPS